MEAGSRLAAWRRPEGLGLDAAGAPHAPEEGGRSGRSPQPAPLTSEGDSLPSPLGEGRGDGGARHMAK